MLESKFELHPSPLGLFEEPNSRYIQAPPTVNIIGSDPFKHIPKAFRPPTGEPEEPYAR